MKRISQSGEAWQKYFDQELSWCDPKLVNREYVSRFARTEWIRKMLGYTKLEPEGVHILEAGCGTGLYAITLSFLGCKVDALDYNPEALKIAKMLLDQVGTDLPVHFYQDNLLDLHCPSSEYDLVFNQAVMEYFLDMHEFKIALREMVRVTRRGGSVAVIVQHTSHPFHWWWELLGWPGYMNQPPVRPITPELLARELSNSGLIEVHIDGIYPWKTFFFWPPWFKRIRWMNELVYLFGRFLEKFVPIPRFLRCRLALQIIAIGQKP